MVSLTQEATTASSPTTPSKPRPPNSPPAKSTDQAKAQALYDYVCATNIRYIGVAFGIGRYQPHTAAEILANQYGDCKDKHTLLAAMLAAEGIQSDAVLIGAGVRFNEPVPSPAAFNHLITHLTLDGKPVWLDTTAEVAPFPACSSSSPARQAIARHSQHRTRHHRPHPARALAADSIVLDSSGSLDDTGVSTTRLVLTFSGDSAIVARAAFRQMQPAQYDQYVQVFSKAIGFSGTASNPDVSRATEHHPALPSSATTTSAEKAGDWEHLKTIPQLMYPSASPASPTSIPPCMPFSSARPPLPKIPPPAWKAARRLGQSLTCPRTSTPSAPMAPTTSPSRFDAGTMYVERRLVILAKKVPVSDWKTYKEWVDKVNPGMNPLHPAHPRQQVREHRPHRVHPNLSAPSDAGLSAKQVEEALNSHDPIFKNTVAYSLAIPQKPDGRRPDPSPNRQSSFRRRPPPSSSP